VADLVRVELVLTRRDLALLERVLRSGAGRVPGSWPGVERVLRSLSRPVPVTGSGHERCGGCELEVTLADVLLDGWKVSPRTRRRCCESGEIPARKSGVTWLVRPSVVAALMDGDHES